MSTGIVLLAAGSGSRFGNRSPKQLARLCKEPLFCSSLRTFYRIPSVREIILVVPPRKTKSYVKWITTLGFNRKVRLVSGGRYRGASVRNGFKAMSPRVSVILVHDSARPLVSKEVIRRVERATKRFGVAVAAWPLPDTLKHSRSKDWVRKTIPRKNLWLAQTPQGFTRKMATRCLLKPSETATDDVELAERRGIPVKIVLGQPQNFKVTFPYDLKICRILK